jgi:hypothetical protein
MIFKTNTTKKLRAENMCLLALLSDDLNNLCKELNKPDQVITNKLTEMDILRGKERINNEN